MGQVLVRLNRPVSTSLRLTHASVDVGRLTLAEPPLDKATSAAQRREPEDGAPAPSPLAAGRSPACPAIQRHVGLEAEGCTLLAVQGGRTGRGEEGGGRQTERGG